MHVSKPWKPVAGHAVSVHVATTGEIACNATITTYRRELHGRLTDSDLHALGVESLPEHARRWLAVYDSGWLWKQTETDRLPSDTLTTCVRHLTDTEAVERFRARWARRLVWVLHLDLIGEPEEFLAPAGRQLGADEHGHTHSETVGIDAGHRIDPADLDWHWAAEASNRHEEHLSGSDHEDLVVRDISRTPNRPPGSRRAA